MVDEKEVEEPEEDEEETEPEKDESLPKHHGGKEYITVTALKHGGTYSYDVPADIVIVLTKAEAKPLLAAGSIREESRRDRIVREALEAEGLDVQEESDKFEGVSLNDLEGARADNTLPGEPE